ALAAFGLALGLAPIRALPPAHGDENMGICEPASNIGVLPPSGGAGAVRALPAGAGFLFDPGCGDPINLWETAPAWGQYNSGGVPNTVMHLAAGAYAVRFSGLGGGTGVPQVTAVGGI